MVCEKCTTKLNKLATIHKTTPNASASSSSSSSTKKHVTNENKLLTMKNRFKPDKVEPFKKCRICKRMCHHVAAHYCQDCAYQKGICCMCGRKILEENAIKGYRQSLT
ncbi:Cysteine-rich PDZ-binding protein [Aphelenchoides besseyi]|nr:Cysteine-rich PDZ-binding protein [Aphelenchoides besseyi]KAI6207682.1 Cysteine-rich PDZ-binding protein [Aphelenchoides besseyi]